MTEPLVVQKLDEVDKAIRERLGDAPGMHFADKDALRRARDLVQQAITLLLGR